MNDDNECLPIPRRSLINRETRYFDSDNEDSIVDRRKPRIILNNSISTDSGVDETIQTSVQLIALYEKTVELAAKNKINAKNAFHFPFVERLTEIIDVVAFDDKIESFQHHSEPNFIKVGSVIDTSAKIYGYRVDALHSETQKLNGTIQNNNDNDLSISTSSDKTEIKQKITQRNRQKSSSYIVTDLSTISLSYEFEFHPFQPANMCQWLGGVGVDSLYADMISYTMYSSSDFPLVNGFVNLNSRVNKEYDDYETLIDMSMKTYYDLISLREIIKENEEEDHILGCQELRQFSFNEDSTESYIETIDECSLIDSSLLNSNDDEDLSNEIVSNCLSELRDDQSNYYFQELQSAHTFPTTMVSMDVTLMNSKMSFVDCIPQLIREKSNSSEYSYFDSTKLKLFAGPYLWKYKNLLNDIKPIVKQQISTVPFRKQLKYNVKIDLFNEDNNRTVYDIMYHNKWNKKYLNRCSRRKNVLITLKHSRRLSFYEKNQHQIMHSRRLRPLNDLVSLNYFPDLNSDNSSDDYAIDHDDHDQMDFIGNDEHVQYDFVRPIHYDKIEIDKHFSKIDAKKLQVELFDEYNRHLNELTDSVSLSNVCIQLIDQGIISCERDQVISAFYCMLNNCNKNQLYMRNNSKLDDLIIQRQPFTKSSSQLTYSQTLSF